MEERFRQHKNKILKITVFGPESTGKTTLCKQLAEHYKTKWVPEFARDYLQKKWDISQKICEPSDLLPIAEGQITDENRIVGQVERLLFCDTNLLLTKVFSETYYNFCDPALDQAAQENQYDLFFLTDIDVPWHPDDLRDKPNNRTDDFLYFEKTIINAKKPFITLSGNEKQRFGTAIDAIDQLVLAKAIGFSSHDFVQCWNHGVDLCKIQNQMDFFKHGIQKLSLVNAAFVNKGIANYSPNEIDDFISVFDNHKNNLKLQKFVPASGAASRMFKFLNEFLVDFDIVNESINGYINRKRASDLVVFLAGLKKFPFYNLIITKLKVHPDYESWNSDRLSYEFINEMLCKDVFKYDSKPKGVLPFYNIKKEIITATDIHLIEATLYANANKKAVLHLTISPEHETVFMDIVSAKKSAIELKFDCEIDVHFSYQKKSTDTLAVNFNNEPLRDEHNMLVFRPGGHGALIENLNTIDADIVFIKNIDNVSILKTNEVVANKKYLAGILITLQKKIFEFLRDLNDQPTDQKIAEIQEFIINYCNFSIKDSASNADKINKIDILKKFLNRPIRVCGMVINEGEPGGGPFWIKEPCGKVSLQIVESSQIDHDNNQQLEILKTSTHFNPVDIVCGLRDYHCKKFDLTQFVNHQSGFIVQKNKNGQDLKGYELPGLWNGAMHDWITIFVEVPLSTFNPVKTVNDLLKPSHQP